MTNPTATAEPDVRRSRLGVGVAAALLVLALAVGVGSVQLGLWTRLGPGPGFFPLVLALVLGAAALVWGIQQWRGTEPEDTEAGEEANGPWTIVLTAGSVVAAALLLELLGFQLTILLFLLFHLRVLHRVRWLVAVPVMLLGSLGTFTLFDLVLDVHLPTSAIEPLALIGL